MKGSRNTVRDHCKSTQEAIGIAYFHRASQNSVQKDLFEGVQYSRRFRSSPRPQVIHLVTLDLAAPGLKPFVTPPLMNDPEQRHATARTTSAFLQEFGLQLAVNGSFFYHFREETPWDYFPHPGQRVWVMGTAISNRIPYKKTLRGFPSVCFTDQKTAQIVDNGQCPTQTIQAISGNEIFVRNGQLVQNPSQRARDWQEPYSRTAIATDTTRRKLWIILVDGKQPLYSEGATMAELAAIATELGATTALNLDGCGSVTLAIGDRYRSKVLNAPIQSKIPTWERPIANHLGFYAQPIYHSK
jgi:hypothetical protein